MNPEKLQQAGIQQERLSRIQGEREAWIEKFDNRLGMETSAIEQARIKGLKEMALDSIARIDEKRTKLETETFADVDREMKRVTRYFKKGYISEEVFKRAEEEYESYRLQFHAPVIDQTSRAEAQVEPTQTQVEIPSSTDAEQVIFELPSVSGDITPQTIESKDTASDKKVRLTGISAKIIEALRKLEASPDKPVTAEALAQEIYGEISDKAIARIYRQVNILRGSSDLEFTIGGIKPSRKNVNQPHGYFLSPRNEEEIPSRSVHTHKPAKTTNLSEASVQVQTPAETSTENRKQETQHQPSALSPRELKFLQVLKDHPEGLTASQIRSIFGSDINISKVAKDIREKDIRYKDLFPRGKGRSSIWIISDTTREVETMTVQQKPTTEPIGTEESRVISPESREKTLSLFLTNEQASLDEMIESIGFMKNGRRMTWNTISSSLRNLVHNILAHERTGNQTPQERELHALIREYMHRHSLVDYEQLATHISQTMKNKVQGKQTTMTSETTPVVLFTSEIRTETTDNELEDFSPEMIDWSPEQWNEYNQQKKRGHKSEETATNSEEEDQPTIDWEKSPVYQGLNENQRGALTSFIKDHFGIEEFNDVMQKVIIDLGRPNRTVLTIPNWDSAQGKPVGEFGRYMRRLLGISQSFERTPNPNFDKSKGNPSNTTAK